MTFRRLLSIGQSDCLICETPPLAMKSWRHVRFNAMQRNVITVVTTVDGQLRRPLCHEALAGKGGSSRPPAYRSIPPYNSLIPSSNPFSHIWNIHWGGRCTLETTLMARAHEKVSTHWHVYHVLLEVFTFRRISLMTKNYVTVGVLSLFGHHLTAAVLKLITKQPATAY